MAHMSEDLDTVSAVVVDDSSASMAHMSEDLDTSSAVVVGDSSFSVSEKEEEVVADELLEVEALKGNFQQLLQLLEGQTDSWSEAQKSLGAITVRISNATQILSWLFDATDNSYEAFQEWWLLVVPQDMPKLLQRIGNCTSLRQIEIEVGIQREFGSELEALLTAIQSNLVLDSLTISSYLKANTTEQRVYEIMGRILQTSRTLKSLSLDIRRLAGDGAHAYHHLASGLRGNDESALEKLSLRVVGLTAIDVRQVAEIVLSATRLSDLRLIEIWTLDNDGIDALAYALAQRTSLKALLLKNVKEGVSALVLKTFTGEGCNRSITSLVLEGHLEGLGNCISTLLSANRSLRDLNWEQSDLSPGEWQTLGQSLISNSSLELVRIRVPKTFIDVVGTLFNAVDVDKACVGLYLNSDEVNSSTWDSESEWRHEEGEDVLREIMKKPVLEFHWNHPRDYPVSNFAKNISNVVKTLSSLHLQMRPQLLGEDFFQVLRDTSTLRLLTIEGGRGESWPGGWKDLMECLHVNFSVTHLRLIHCDGLDDDVFRQFMGVLQVPTIHGSSSS